MSNMTSQTEKQEETQTQQQLSEQAKNKLSQLDLTLVTTSQYFKPEDGKTYMIQINPEDDVEMIKNPRFASPDGTIPTRFEFKIKHIDNQAEQKWTVSKTLCKQIADVLGTGARVMEIARHGTDRSTTYDVKAIQ